MSFAGGEKINSLYKGGYRFISKLEMHRDIGASHSRRFDVVISLSNGSGQEASIVAHECTEILIGKIDNMLAAFVEIADLRKDQIEGVRYKIFDSENDLFSILCLEFEVVI